jgi:hypothetical protein
MIIVTKWNKGMKSQDTPIHKHYSDGDSIVTEGDAGNNVTWLSRARLESLRWLIKK